ncbi:MAG TPA: thymidine phosphorylase [Ilumatobacteraceae bacterium]|nr:thymidine phosphorylase [Ilumatobacteraceae bacterium]HRB03737.1 thymidine phosphorylase [Ilumatobacteraceae bacterium]
MIPQEIIRAKRDGQVLSDNDIGGFIAGLANGAVTEGQAAAFAMAVYFQGMNIAERVALTKAMRDSGTVLNWDLPGPVLDKHSTGGVGDTVSLMLAPMVAACGGYVPMISGRGLGHTGGTYDKMESIPGYVAAPTMTKFRSVVGKIGCAIIGQTPDLAPADKRLYGIRDVTATVESIGLITASILSKKLAAGLAGLAMDVKCGNGAFMATLPAARELARSIVEVATGAGLPTTALITDMNRPLADAAGNALEVAYAIDYLTGVRRDPRTHEITMALCTEMLLHGKLARTPKAARARLQAALDSGAAAEKFGQMVVALGGPKKLVERPWQHLERAPLQVAVVPARGGTVSAIDTRAVGMVVVALGGGRTRPQDPVDHAVGLTELAGHGEVVGADRPLAIVHARTQAQVDEATTLLRAAYRIGGKQTKANDPVLDRITV